MTTTTPAVPAGVPHSEGNPGPGEIEGVVELRPALLTKEFPPLWALAKLFGIRPYYERWDSRTGAAG
jgi:hypothetical protein